MTHASTKRKSIRPQAVLPSAAAATARRTASTSAELPSQASIASSRSSGWPPLPDILLEPRAHVQYGDFDKMVLMQDEQAQRESQKAKQKAQSKQAMVKKVLEDQLSQIQQEKNAAKEQKKKEATELRDSIRQYEEEEFQKWQQHKEQQAKTKQMYSQQVAEARQRHQLEREEIQRESALEQRRLAQEERQAAAERVAKAEQDKVMLAKVTHDNELRLQQKAQAAQQAKLEEQRLNAEYQAEQDRQEQKRINDVKAREAKSHAKYEMAGGNALSRRLSEIAAMDEVKAAKLQDEYEAQQDATLQKKKRDRQEQQQLLMRTRQQQMQERKQKEEEEQAADRKLAQQHGENIPRGDTAGANLILENVTVQAGHRDLLEDVSWRLMPGQRVGLVGANGCGKSTLLRCLSGHRRVDNGRLVVGNRVEMGYLEQTAVSGSDRTVWEEARSRMTELIEAEAAIDAASQAASLGSKGADDGLQAAMDKFEAAGGYDADKRIANVLTGLGFKQEEWNKSCGEFSGGWQMRIALARLLLGPAGQSASSGGQGGLLLLDEPTNHLDSAACKWLGAFLRNSSGGAVIVSHDQDLLQDACDQIVEAQSRAKQLEKIKSNMVAAPAASAGDGPGDARKVALKLPKAPPCHQEVLIMEDASIGWGEPNGLKDPLLTGVKLKVEKGQRVLVLGPNGAGKTTLLKVLAGAVPIWGGMRHLGEGAKISVFSQDLAQDLPMDRKALEYVLEKARVDDVNITQEQGRRSLGALGLSGEMALARIGDLSGGEKARVALAAFALVPCNLLLLDEASNHLDAATINALTTALQAFDGAIVAITHNKAFADSLHATHVLRVQGGKAKLSAHMGELVESDFTHKSENTQTKKQSRPKVLKLPQASDGMAQQTGQLPKPNAQAQPAANGHVQVAAKGPATQSPAPAAAVPAKKATKPKLGYREKQELDRLPAEIDSLAPEQISEALDMAQDSSNKLFVLKHPLDSLSKSTEASKSSGPSSDVLTIALQAFEGAIVAITQTRLLQTAYTGPMSCESRL
ncbi:hypothetical protein WJX79_002387 [Trebouxia sp. C0005]